MSGIANAGIEPTNLFNAFGFGSDDSGSDYEPLEDERRVGLDGVAVVDGHVPIYRSPVNFVDGSSHSSLELMDDSDGSSSQDPTPADLSAVMMLRMKVSELRAAFKERNCDSKGLKKVLLSRLQNFVIASNNGPVVPDNPAPDNPVASDHWIDLIPMMTMDQLKTALKFRHCAVDGNELALRTRLHDALLAGKEVDDAVNLDDDGEFEVCDGRDSGDGEDAGDDSSSTGSAPAADSVPHNYSVGNTVHGCMQCIVLAPLYDCAYSFSLTRFT